MRAEGAAARDAVWTHPDTLPTAADLDDPLAYAERTKEADSLDVESEEFDAALAKFLDESSDESGSDDSEGSGPDDSGDSGDSPRA